MSDPITPADLSRELGVSQLRIRNYLRRQQGKLGPFVTRWKLSPSQAADVRAQFAGKR